MSRDMAWDLLRALLVLGLYLFFAMRILRFRKK